MTIRLNDILEKVNGYHPGADLEFIKKAYVYSAKVHQGQVRKSGEPYLIHPLEVAYVLAELKLDEASIVAGILHDTIEDTLATPEELTELFGKEVAEIVDGVTKLGQFTAQQKVGEKKSDKSEKEGEKPGLKSKEAREEEKQAENFRKMLVAMAKDIRVILVKLADRTHNMRTLESMKPEKQVRIARETMDIYAPLANRLGISWIKTELEDLCFKYLRPDDYKTLNDELERTSKDRDKYIGTVVKLLDQKLAANQLKGTVSGRPKHLYSIYKKLKQKGVGLDDLHDIIAFRVIVPTVPDCYATLGMVHAAFKPVPSRFKDFIALPKENNYRSLHTTVIGPDGRRIEIQIRTEEMHRQAEEGIAAHWAYKEGNAGKGFFTKDEQQFAWLRQLMEWQKELKDPKEFLDAVKVDLFTDECFVFTPKGDVKALPLGASPIDFAYAIHSAVGEKCTGAKVNGKIAPLATKLKNGDVVEILTGPNARPSKDWLAFVKTSKAQNRIRAFIQKQERDKSREFGHEVVEREFRKAGLNYAKLAKEDDGALVKAANELGYRNLEDVEVAIGIGKVAPSQLIKAVAPDKELGPDSKDDAIGPGRRLTDIFKKFVEITGAKGKGGVVINGVDDVLVRFGKCCQPVPGDPIGGFITRGRGISVHRRDCRKLAETEAERRIDVMWDVKSDYRRNVSVRVTSDDRAGLLAEMTEVFRTRSIPVVQANARALNEASAVSTFEIAVADAKQLNDVIGLLGRLKGVHSVERL